MINQIVTRVSLESFRERSAGKRAVLLYPWTNYRQLFLGHFLAAQEDGLLYYALPHEMETVAEWMTDLVAQFNLVLDDFGSNLRAALPDADAPALGQAFVQDLAAVSSDHVTLFIDELDRMTFDDHFTQFITTTVSALPDHVQLAFSSRMLLHKPWSQMVKDGKAIVLGTEYRKNDMMFTVEDENKPQLEIYGFGSGHALVDGQEIVTWDGALPRNLFFYFVDNPLVTRDDIFATFWPTLSVKEATNVFHVTKRKISERISDRVSDGENYELTQYSAGFYMPSDKVVRHYDVDDFEEAIENATITNDIVERETLLRRAIDLYTSPFLETIDMPWVEERRQHLRQVYAQALASMGHLQKEKGEADAALGFFVRATKETPEREDIHREIMKIYIDKDMPNDAKAQYETLANFLKEEYEIEPSQTSQSVLETIES